MGITTLVQVPRGNARNDNIISVTSGKEYNVMLWWSIIVLILFYYKSENPNTKTVIITLKIQMIVMNN